MRLPQRAVLDDWLPTVVRWLGVASLVYGVFLDHFSNPAIIPAATGMLLFKTVVVNSDKLGHHDDAQ